MAKNFFMDSQFLGSTAKSKPPKCLDSRCLQGPDKPIGKRKRAEHRCPALWYRPWYWLKIFLWLKRNRQTRLGFCRCRIN